MENNNVEFQQPEFQQPEYSAPETAPVAKKDLKKILVPVVIGVVALAIVLTTIFFIIPLIQHNMALDHIDSGNNQEAYDLLSKNPDFQDNKELLSHFFTAYKEEISTTYRLENGEMEKSGASKYVREYNPDGSIKSEVYYSFNMEKEEWVKEHEETCNENGDTLTYVEYNDEGEVSEKRVYTYDDNGNKLTNERYDENDEKISKTTYEYDENDNMIAAKYFDKDGEPTGKSTYEYDENGNEIAYKSFDKDGKLQYKTVTEYDENDNILSEKEYNSEGQLTSKYVCEYDEDGNMLTRAYYNSDGELSYKYTYEYDEHGYAISVKYYTKYDDSTEKVTFKNTYDDNGNLIKRETIDKNDEVSGTMLIEWHDNGMPAAVTQKNAAGELEHKSSMDKAGNTLSAESYNNGELQYKYEYKYTGEVLCYNEEFPSELLEDMLESLKRGN